jgi:hypothetical protein
MALPASVPKPNIPFIVEEKTKEGGPGKVDDKPQPKRKRWYQRPTIRKLKKEAEEEDREFTRKWDERENKETRLPASEAIHLGGLVFTEAFTPSTVSSLYDTLERWPVEQHAKKQEWLDGLAKSRGGHRGGWQNLGVIRPPGTFIMGDGHHDTNLPPGIDAVWINVSYITPAVAVVVATFTITEEAGDLSGLLRNNYRTEHFDARVRVYGRWGSLRARIPWARPARHGLGYSISHAEDQKRKACEALIQGHEQACSKWFFDQFRGRFAAAEDNERPRIRLIFLKQGAPYADRHPWLRPVDLDFAHPLWRSTEPKGWWLSEERWSRQGNPHVAVLAAKRSDGADEPTQGEKGESNWYLTQQFGTDYASLAARHALTALLAIYSSRLALLRDKAGIKRRFRRPVREGRELDNYLIRDGLDAATVTSDLKSFTEDLTMFRWDVPEFTEHREHLGKGAQKRPLLEYVPSLCSSIRERAAQLASDTATTTQNIKAAAELRQAIANTRLQRLTSALSVIAVIIAIISLLGTK